MSNEEIVIRIQAGETDLMEQLWAGVERLVRWKVRRISKVIDGRYGVESDDLYQSGYLAMMSAVETYKPENGSFSTWLMFYLKSAFAETTGIRTTKGRMEPINNAVSLDKPLGDEEDGASFGDLVPDPKAAATMDAVEETLWREQLHEALEGVLAELPEDQSAVLRQRYYDQQTFVGAAQSLGTTPEEVRKLEGKGLKALRHYKLANRIRPFYEFDCYAGTGLGAFRNSGMSVQERYLIKQERTAATRE